MEIKTQWDSCTNVEEIEILKKYAQVTGWGCTYFMGESMWCEKPMHGMLISSIFLYIFGFHSRYLCRDSRLLNDPSFIEILGFRKTSERITTNLLYCPRRSPCRRKWVFLSYRDNHHCRLNNYPDDVYCGQHAVSHVHTTHLLSTRRYRVRNGVIFISWINNVLTRCSNRIEKWAFRKGTGNQNETINADIKEFVNEHIKIMK